MRVPPEKHLFSRVAGEKYIGRLDQIERLYLHAVAGSEPFRTRVAGAPGAGTSELLRKVYDRLFYEQRFVVPFYFAVNSADENARSAAARFAYQFLLQAIAFLRNDPDLISSAPDICELADLAPLGDADWVDKMCAVCRNDGPLNDDRAFIRSALAAPNRASSYGRMRTTIIIDDLHKTMTLDGGSVFFNEAVSLASNSRTALVIGGRRKVRFPENGFERIDLDVFDREDAAVLIEIKAADLGIKIGEQARDLIAVKFDGDLELIGRFLNAANVKGRSLDGFRDVEQFYVDELLNGSIGNRFDDILRRASPDPGTRNRLIETLGASVEAGNDRFSLDALRDRLGSTANEFEKLVMSLEIDEVIEVRSELANVSTFVPLRDFLELHRRSKIDGGSLAATSAFAVTRTIKRAPQALSRVYRREAALGVQELLSSFDIRVVPRGLVDYRVFRDKYKGISDNEIRQAAASETDTVILPQIVHAAPILEHLPEFGEPVEPERAVFAVGFTDRTYRDEDQIVWLTAEIDSKLEADHALTLEWCDRLSRAAESTRSTNYRIWLIAPEGFSDGALDLIAERGGYGSSRRQVELLRNYLNDDETEKGPKGAEYEIVIPIGSETEIVAAHTLEEIARRYNFPAKTINQIKTALVEACINAAEHSMSPDQKIHQKFVIDAEKIVITVSNRGLRLADKIAAIPSLENPPADSRRGWGLNLIRGLMDEVMIESVDDGTRIVMTKYLRP